MGTYCIQGIAAATFLAALMAIPFPAVADQPASTGKIGEMAPAKQGSAADNALRRTPLPVTRSADRAQCRDLAARRKLFGLRRHKFLQRCRRARRKLAPSAPAIPQAR